MKDTRGHLRTFEDTKTVPKRYQKRYHDGTTAVP
nr:MAG TPA: hypothetical protein [Caudoviricetes sp.]